MLPHAAPYNALLRIDNCSQVLPKPFEKPRQEFDFWVLELPVLEGEDFNQWAQRTVKLLLLHEQTLKSLCEADASLTLFIANSCTSPAFRVETLFLQILSRMQISLEFSITE
jgi:hypothetical protein